MEPEISGFEFYFEAFYEISTSRQFGMGIGPLPFTAIKEYFDIYDIGEVENFDDFSYVMRRMDRVYLELNTKDISKGSNGGNKSSGGPADKKNNNKV